MYVDGDVDATLSVGAFTPRFDSIQHAAIGTALNSTGRRRQRRPRGFFNGAIDEVRIWNYARSPAQILSGTNREIPAASGLLGRLGLNEGTGTSVASSVGAVTGTIVGTNCSWVSGAHMPGGLNAAPDVDAGPDQTVTLPASGTLVGSATDDGRSGAPVTTLWSQVSGPGDGDVRRAGGRDHDGRLHGARHLRPATQGRRRRAVGDRRRHDRRWTASSILAPVVEAGANQTITLAGQRDVALGDGDRRRVAGGIADGRRGARSAGRGR